MPTFVLAGGRFRSLDAAYRALRGITSVVCGHAGEQAGSPDAVEAVAVTFDAEVLPAEVVLDVFFTVHDPRRSDGGEPDTGGATGSVLFAADAGQRRLFELARNRVAQWYDGGVVTAVESLGVFVPAARAEQGHCSRHPDDVYCRTTAAAAVGRVRARFPDHLAVG